MNLINIEDYQKPSDEFLVQLEWLDTERDEAYDRIKNATNQFQLDQANSMLNYLQWRYELLEL